MNPSEDEQHATVAEAEREAVAVVVTALRRDAERWRWAKEHPRIAVNIFDLQWMEQRDLDAVIDAAMGLKAKKSCLNCIPCQFKCDAGKWNLNGQVMDCFGCDGSGIDTRCEEHKEEDDEQ